MLITISSPQDEYSYVTNAKMLHPSKHLRILILALTYVSLITLNLSITDPPFNYLFCTLSTMVAFLIAITTSKYVDWTMVRMSLRQFTSLFTVFNVFLFWLANIPISIYRNDHYASFVLFLGSSYIMFLCYFIEAVIGVAKRIRKVILILFILYLLLIIITEYLEDDGLSICVGQCFNLGSLKMSSSLNLVITAGRSLIIMVSSPLRITLLSTHPLRRAGNVVRRGKAESIVESAIRKDQKLKVNDGIVLDDVGMKVIEDTEN